METIKSLIAEIKEVKSNYFNYCSFTISYLFEEIENQIIINTFLNSLSDDDKVEDEIIYDKVEEDEINDDKIMDYKVHPIANMIKECVKLSNCGNYHYFDKQKYFVKTKCPRQLKYFGTRDNRDNFIINTNQYFWKNDSFLNFYRNQQIIINNLNLRKKTKKKTLKYDYYDFSMFYWN